MALGTFFQVNFMFFGTRDISFWHSSSHFHRGTTSHSFRHIIGLTIRCRIRWIGIPWSDDPRRKAGGGEWKKWIHFQGNGYRISQLTTNNQNSDLSFYHIYLPHPPPLSLEGTLVIHRIVKYLGVSSKRARKEGLDQLLVGCNSNCLCPNVCDQARKNSLIEREFGTDIKKRLTARASGRRGVSSWAKRNNNITWISLWITFPSRITKEEALSQWACNKV